MRRRTLTTALVFALISTASAALLIAGFGLKQQEAVPQSAALGAPEGSAMARIDGRIDAGEYSYRYRDPVTGIDLQWRIEQGDGEQGGLIYMGLRSPQPGRVEVVLAPAGMMMTGGDVLIGFVKDAQLAIRDDYADGPTSNYPDTELGGTDDILSAAGTQPDDGVTTIELVRALETRDIAYDKAISPGRMRVRLGNSRFANFVGLGGDSWSSLDLDFFTGEVFSVPAR